MLNFNLMHFKIVGWEMVAFETPSNVRSMEELEVECAARKIEYAARVKME